MVFTDKKTTKYRIVKYKNTKIIEITKKNVNESNKFLENFLDLKLISMTIWLVKKSELSSKNQQGNVRKLNF